MVRGQRGGSAAGNNSTQIGDAYLELLNGGDGGKHFGDQPLKRQQTVCSLNGVIVRVNTLMNIILF